VDVEARRGRADRGRTLVPFEHRPALFAVEAAVAQSHAAVPHIGREHRAAPLAPHPPHLEDVGEVRLVIERQDDPDRRLSVVPEPDAFVARAFPDEAGAKEVHEVPRKHLVRIGQGNVGIRQVGAEQLVVLLDACAEEEQALVVQPQPEPREISRALVVDALVARTERAHVAVQIEKGERITVLENETLFSSLRSGREDVELILDLDHIFHASPRRRAVGSSSSAALHAALDTLRVSARS
jgi:hypothetical protein